MAQWTANYPNTSGRYTLYLDVSLVSQNIAANTSTIRIQLWARSNSGYGSWTNNQYTFAWTAGGHSDSGTSNLRFDSGGDYAGKTISLVNTTRVVTHNADGTFSGTASGYHGGGSTFGQAVIGTQSFTLPRIPRGPRLRAGGTYRNTLAYVRHAGVWKVAVPYVKHAGTWKVGGG